jgi:broad specificity phosphatase PhoE
MDDKPLYGDQGDVPFEKTSETSAEAARSLGKDRIAKLEAVVLSVLTRTPRTCDEVEMLTGLPHQTASARLRGLVLKKLVEDSGEKRVTRYLKKATVWRIVPKVAA